MGYADFRLYPLIAPKTKSLLFGLKKILRKDHKKIAYNLIKKFFEYANGCQPDLRQRFDLYSMIPDDPKKCKIRDLLIHTLDYSLIK